jgi:hypothetical protein
MLDGMDDPTPPWREPFERALDEGPSDQGVRRDLADHLDELGDPDGEAVRWLADNGKWPGPPRLGIDPLTDGFWNWWTEGSRAAPSHNVPLLLRRHLAGSQPGVVYGAYPTRRAAEADLCRAFHAARAAGWGPDSV